YFPKAYHHMRTRVREVINAQPGTSMAFKSSAYPTGTINFGPRTVCQRHMDTANYPGIPCAITPFGDFNPDTGGDLYLWQLKLRIRFPPAATIIVSSAGIAHGNVPVNPGERRYSFTQYCPGGLVRWAAYGCRPASDFDDADREQMDSEAVEGLAAQLAHFSTLTGLKDDQLWLREQEQVMHAL
ncbi:hypothetical protein DENSPDRAFT_787758, partial [Dentipellis sp. KUC8613]